MANEEHLARLKQGVEAWNAWRTTNPSIQPDLSRAEFTGARLTGTDVHGIHMVILSVAHLPKLNLSKVNLSEAHLAGTILSTADLSRANLSGAILVQAHLSEAYLMDANLTQTNLIMADLSRAILTRADLSGADLSGAILSGAILSGADLQGAKLPGVELTRADLSEVNLHKATIGGTIFGDVDLSTTRGLETIKHEGPSTIGLDTLYRSHGNIPEIFLRGAGVPDEMITYSKSLVGRPFEFYSCFISYSSKDQEFAERLYADLQNKGVRCWFALEDLRIGAKWRTSIDEAIRFRDKLLLVLSTHSIASEWVETEVETAVEEEHRRKKPILFPIRLDDSVLETHQAWAAHIRRTRHIGDFQQWKDHDAYQQAFQRLLRDLKTDI